jgi:Ca2+-binding RTX toxin-like protein
MRTLGLTAAGMTLTAALALAAPAAGDFIIGTDGDDILRGTPRADSIEGLGGKDDLFGRAGGDFLFGGDGTDTLRGGPGADTLLGQASHDRIWGGDGSDFVSGGAWNDQIRGGAGDDVNLDGGNGKDTIRGGGGVDRLSGDVGNDVLYPGPGADYTTAGGGRDQILLLPDAGAPDRIGCGLGADLVFYRGRVDPADVLSGCERVESSVPAG